MLMSHMRAAMQKYRMVDDGDVIAVGVSGGKDSLALLCALCELKRFYPKQFSVKAITIDPQFNSSEGDFSAVEQLCEKLGIEYIVKRTQLAQVIFNERGEKNPCSLCAKMRRGILHDAAKEAGCNKVALGHHLDDAVVTFYMNLLQGGKIGCFSPVSYLSRKELHVIRPMIFAKESEVARVARKLDLPVAESACPVDKNTERERMQQLINALEKENGYNAIYQKTLGAMQRAAIDGWGQHED